MELVRYGEMTSKRHVCADEGRVITLGHWAADGIYIAWQGNDSHRYHLHLSAEEVERIKRLIAERKV